MEAHPKSQPKIEIVWNCGDCAKDFATEKLIKAHLRKKHPEYLREEKQIVLEENKKGRKRWGYK